MCHLARSGCLREADQGSSSSRSVFVDEPKWLKCTEADNSDNYVLVVGGSSGATLDTVEVVSLSPTSNPVPNCTRVLGNFPTAIMRAVGTRFGKLNNEMQATD